MGDISISYRTHHNIHQHYHSRMHQEQLRINQYFGSAKRLSLVQFSYLLLSVHTQWGQRSAMNISCTVSTIYGASYRSIIRSACLIHVYICTSKAVLVFEVRVHVRLSPLDPAPAHKQHNIARLHSSIEEQ